MGPLQMDFTFMNIRKFDQVFIHINNHYTKDIQIFSRAKEHSFLTNLLLPQNFGKNKHTQLTLKDKLIAIMNAL